MKTQSLLRGRRGKILRAIMEAIIPRGGAFEASPADYDLIPKAEEFLSRFDALSRNAIPLLFYYVQFSSLPRTGRFFTTLSPERAGQLLGAMEESPFYYRRAIVMLLKVITTLAFFDIDEVAAEIGYSHGCHLRDMRQ